jgi:hypothetical protein
MTRGGVQDDEGGELTAAYLPQTPNQSEAISGLMHLLGCVVEARRRRLRLRLKCKVIVEHDL